MTHEELLAVLQEAAARNTVELDLSGKGLTSLPPELFRLTSLSYLDLHDNQIDTLPPEIGQLINLEVLNLGCNAIASLPPDICRLTKMELLVLDGNPIAPPLSEAAARGIKAVRQHFGFGG
jgi:Leucine-rich repeat (LRR) protein